MNWQILKNWFLSKLRRHSRDVEWYLRAPSVNLTCCTFCFSSKLDGRMNAGARTLPERGISYDIGWQLPPTAYGNLGYAMLCSESLLDSVNIMERYWALISKSASRFNWYEQDDLCVIDLTINDHL